MQKLLNILDNFITVSEQGKEILNQIVEKKEFPKGHLLLQQNTVCKNLYLIESGFLRGFCFEDGKDKTLWFSAENEIVTSMYSFITQKTGFENIELLDHSSLYCITYRQLQDLYSKYPEFNFIGRLLTEKYYIELEERTMSLQLQSAQIRYKHLLESKPELFQRASLGQIASYLGISQETLSRIRGKK